MEQISSSDQLKREYDELQEQKARAEEKSALIYHEKRTIVKERKQMKAQKNRGGELSRLTAWPCMLLFRQIRRCLHFITDTLTLITHCSPWPFPQKLLKTQYSLWQLYTIEKDREKIEAALAVDRQSLQQVQEEKQSLEHELTAKKKEQSSFLKEVTFCERCIATKKLELNEKVNFNFNFFLPESSYVLSELQFLFRWNGLLHFHTTDYCSNVTYSILSMLYQGSLSLATTHVYQSRPVLTNSCMHNVHTLLP